MAKKKSDPTFDRNVVLNAAVKALMDERDYPAGQITEISEEECAVIAVGGSPQVLVWVPSNEGAIMPEDKEMVMLLGASVEKGPASYCWATTTGVIGEGYVHSFVEGLDGEVPEVPAADTESEGRGRVPIGKRADARQFKALQQEFDNLHEYIYQVKESVDSSNDITANLCKCIFLKMHVEHYPDFTITNPAEGRSDDILVLDWLQPARIRSEKVMAVTVIKAAFSKAKGLDEYNTKDDFGHDFKFFDADDFIKFNKFETYARIFDCLMRHRLSQPEETNLEDDVLGRAFDVMLRRRFEGKGGLGVYLTPQQVRDAMVQMAFHDILKENSNSITARDPKSGKQTFRVCDPTCGSAGFLVRAMREVRQHVEKLVGMTDKQKEKLLREIYRHGFIGADNAPNMVLMARINMALHGDPLARAYRVENSLTAEVFKPESFDLILTNPPFKKGGVTSKDSPEILEAYRDDIIAGEPGMAGDKRALGAKPNAKGQWRPVNSVDPAVLFIDRCLQLLKPGGRLLTVLPDGILCNSGDRYVREYIMGAKDEETGRFVGGKAIVKAVVSLPPVTFRLSGAGAKTSFLYLQKKRPGDEQGPVFMAVADEVGFDVKQNKEVLTDRNDLARILEIYRKGPEAAAE